MEVNEIAFMKQIENKDHINAEIKGSRGNTRLC